jgi:hypothetical protein
VAEVTGALGLTRMMNSLLFGVKTYDPITFFSVMALLLFFALCACLVPARRSDVCRSHGSIGNGVVAEMDFATRCQIAVRGQ